tara:strand:- start:42 stop:1601 length:1560 start_codon:yes stop_codon:yes gene_type:complete
MKQLSEKEEQTKDQKILKLLQKGPATRDEITKVLGTDLPASTVSTAINRLEKKKWIKKVSGEEKKWELVSNEELEKLILFACPIKFSKETKVQAYDEFKEKVTGEKNPQKNEKLLEKKDADDFEFYLEKMEEEGSLVYNNGKYSLTESACRKINYCYECKKPISDGKTPTVLMNQEDFDIYNLPIHAKCYANWEGRHHFDYHSENFCDYCGLSFSSEKLVRNFEETFAWYDELDELLTIHEKEKFVEATKKYILEDISYDCKSEIGEEQVKDQGILDDLKIFVKSLKPNSKFQNIPDYNTAKMMKTTRWDVTLKLEKNYLNTLLEKFGELTVYANFRKHPNKDGSRSLSDLQFQKYKVTKDDIDNFHEMILESVNAPFTEDGDTEYEDVSLECRLVSINPFYRTKISVSNLERFFEFVENHSTNFEVKQERKEEIFKIISEKENKSSADARKVVNQLFDPISLITEKMDPPQYHSEYVLEDIQTSMITKPYGMAWIHKENGKIYHPYCYDKIKKGEEQK